MFEGPPELFLTTSAIDFKPGPWIFALLVGDFRPGTTCVTDVRVWLSGGPTPGGWPPEKVAIAGEH